MYTRIHAHTHTHHTKQNRFQTCELEARTLWGFSLEGGLGPTQEGGGLGPTGEMGWDPPRRGGWDPPVRGAGTHPGGGLGPTGEGGWDPPWAPLIGPVRIRPSLEASCSGDRRTEASRRVAAHGSVREIRLSLALLRLAHRSNFLIYHRDAVREISVSKG